MRLCKLSLHGVHRPGFEGLTHLDWLQCMDQTLQRMVSAAPRYMNGWPTEQTGLRI